ncbi:MAG: FCD domain-containing protein [Pseudomonadota bacterium]
MINTEGESDAPKTVTEAVYRRVRTDILWGRLPPGTPLKSNDLRGRYEVGISPLREALSRLASERLVISSGQRGFRVAPIDEESICDISQTRLVIEHAALKKSIEEGDVDWETRVVATHHALSRVPIPRKPGQEAETWTRHHRAYHMALISACGSQWQMHIAGLLFDQAERFRIIRAKEISFKKDERDPAKEHHQILEAVLDRDVSSAVKALEQHYRSTMNVAIEALVEEGDLEIG